jgi:hypothetical protein
MRPGRDRPYTIPLPGHVITNTMMPLAWPGGVSPRHVRGHRRLADEGKRRDLLDVHPPAKLHAYLIDRRWPATPKRHDPHAWPPRKRDGLGNAGRDLMGRAGDLA